MCSGSLDIGAFSARHLLDFPIYFQRTLELLKPLEDDGLVTCSPEFIDVTGRGQFVLRNIARCFDAYVEGSDIRYSRAV
jgi:oxygen-independent coproporphyrinogen-3 oxidase